MKSWLIMDSILKDTYYDGYKSFKTLFEFTCYYGVKGINSNLAVNMKPCRNKNC